MGGLGMKTAFIAAMAGIALGVGVALTSAAAWAAYQEGNGTDFSSNGVSYTNKSFSGSSQNRAGSFIQRNDNGPAGPNKMGVQAIIYNQADQVCASTLYSYNSVTTAYWRNDLVPPVCGGVYLYSKGNTEAYNGHGYKNVPTKQTPFFLP